MATTMRSDGGRPAPIGAGWGAIGALWRRPHRGWRRIERAPASVAGLFTAIAVPLAAIGPAARLVHDLAFGRSQMGIIQYRPTLAGGIVAAAIGWAMALVAIALLLFATGALAPRFGGQRDQVGAAKTAIFGGSAFFAAAIFAVLPAVTWLQIVGLYSLILLAVGAPRLLRVPDERATGFGAAVAGVGLASAIALALAQGWVLRRSLEPTVKSEGHRVIVRGTPAIAGARLVAPANTKKSAVAPGSGAAAADVVPASSLQALLPNGVEGFTRTAVQSQSNLSGGVATASASGTYVADTNSFQLTITDAGRPGALATDNSLIAGEFDRTTDAGWQRSHVVNGVRVTEKWTNADHGGSFSRTVAGRFTVEARGTAPGVQTLRAAVASVDAARLAALRR